MWASWLCALEDDGFEHVGDVFGLVGGHLENLDEFLVLDENDGIALLFEELADGVAAEAVGFILEAIDFDEVLEDFLILFEERDTTLKRLGLTNDDFCDLECGGWRSLDLVDHDAVGGGIDEVENVVE